MIAALTDWVQSRSREKKTLGKEEDTLTFYAAIGFAAAMFVLAASPGPGVFATTARALASGFHPAIAVIVGIVAGDIIFLLFAIYGLSMAAEALGNFFVIVKLCGSAYLIFLGVKIWFSKPKFEVYRNDHFSGTLWGNFISGLVITLSNPKVILFYCGFLPTFFGPFLPYNHGRGDRSGNRHDGSGVCFDDLCLYGKSCPSDVDQRKIDTPYESGRR